MPITPDEYTYPFDPTGTAPSNKVTGEVHVITQQNHRDYSFIVPTFAPFFADGVEIIFTDVDGNPVDLIEGTDYYFGHHFLAASRAISKQVYGSISFITKDFKGTMSLGYQTIGGKWTYDQAYLNQLMTNIVSNPRSSSWDSIVELPALFPVIDHEWNLIDMVGMSHVVAGLFGIEEALRDPTGTGTGGGSGSQLMEHILDNQNPHHTTKLQVGLGNVLNYGMATQADAETGIADNMYMSPILVKQAVASQVGNALTVHLADDTNPHNVNAGQVGLGSVQNYDVATTAEAQAGAVNNKYMTPLHVKEAIVALAISVIDTHKIDYTNPHQTTKAQVGLSNVDNYATASTAEAQVGTVTNKFMTPSLVKDAINAMVGAGVSTHLTNTNNPHSVTAAQVGAYTKAESDTLLLAKQDTTATAANSSKLENLSVAQLTAQILSNKIAAASDADTLNGYSYSDIINSITVGTSSNAMRLENKTLTEVLQLAAAQTVANASKFENMTMAELYASIPGNVAVAHQFSFDGVPALSAGTELYTELFHTTTTNPGDVQVIVSGGGTSQAGSDSFSYLVKVNPRDSTIDVINLFGIDSTLQFGLISILNGSVTELHLWMKSGLQRQQVAVTELTNQFAIVPDFTPRAYLGASVGANVTTAMPVGWVATSEVNVFKSLTTHTGRTDNPHATTKAQVGLGSVDNYATATTADAQAGTATNLFMTPVRVKEAINQFASSAITSHTGNTSNPHAVTKAQVGLGNVDNYATADQATAEVGTANDKFMTPLRTAQAITAQVGNNLSTLVTDLTTLFNGLTV